MLRAGIHYESGMGGIGGDVDPAVGNQNLSYDARTKLVP